MPRSGFEPAIPMFERPKTVLALDRAPLGPACTTNHSGKCDISWQTSDFITLVLHCDVRYPCYCLLMGRFNHWTSSLHGTVFARADYYTPLFHDTLLVTSENVLMGWQSQNNHTDDNFKTPQRINIEYMRHWRSLRVYPKVFGLRPITKYTLTTINTRWEATVIVMAEKLTRLTHKITVQVHQVAGSCTICRSCSRRPVRKLLDTPSSYIWRDGHCEALREPQHNTKSQPRRILETLVPSHNTTRHDITTQKNSRNAGVLPQQYTA
jgi:hypothetical protein